MKPFISVIIAVFNGERYLEQTIQSIVAQTYDDKELIIIDGGSTDKTVEIIKKYESKIAYWVSEKDKGIADAFNKGVKAARGDYINFQGDGDGFFEPDSLAQIMEGINPNKDMLVCGRIQRIALDGTEIYKSRFTKKFNPKSLLLRMSLPHQGLFTHASFFKKYGLFDVDNVYCMDYEHLLRAYHSFPRVVTRDIVVAKWRADGIGNGKTLEIFKEYDKIKRRHHLAGNTTLNLIKYWILLKFYIKTKLLGQ